jgi:hypothetical protein
MNTNLMLATLLTAHQRHLEFASSSAEGRSQVREAATRLPPGARQALPAFLFGPVSRRGGGLSARNTAPKRR